MKTKLITVGKVEKSYHEVEFVDMHHTLEWLLETAENCCCSEAVPHLKAAREVIFRKRRSLFE